MTYLLIRLLVKIYLKIHNTKANRNYLRNINTQDDGS